MHSGALKQILPTRLQQVFPSPALFILKHWQCFRNLRRPSKERCAEPLEGPLSSKDKQAAEEGCTDALELLDILIHTARPGHFQLSACPCCPTPFPSLPGSSYPSFLSWSLPASCWTWSFCWITIQYLVQPRSPNTQLSNFQELSNSSALAKHGSWAGVGEKRKTEDTGKAGETGHSLLCYLGEPPLVPTHYFSSPGLKNSSYLMPQFSGPRTVPSTSWPLINVCWMNKVLWFSFI